MDVKLIFGQMLVLCSMMLIGYFSYRRDWITDDMSKRLSKLVVNIFNPILVVNGVLGQSNSGSGDIMVNLLLVLGYYVLLILFSYVILLLLRPKRQVRSVYRLMTIFSNLGFMAIPLIRAIYGNEAMIYIAFYILGYNLLLYTYGFGLANRAAAEYSGKETEKNNWKESLKKMMNPGVGAALLALVIFAFGIKVPLPMATFCDYMGNATIPLSMIMIGVTVAQVDMKKMFGDYRIYLFILIRMILLPVALILLLRGLPINEIVFGVFVIEIGMPVGSIVTLVAKESGADAEYCTKGIVLSTLASIVTIPLICMFL